MRRVWEVLTCLLLIGAFAGEAAGQQLTRPWWVGGEVGEGQLLLFSDQSPGTRNSTFAMGFVGGHSLGSRARIGMELNGWLLQAFNLHDPAEGESVSNVMGIADLFPAPKVPLFIRAGIGGGFYTNNRPGGLGGSGMAWTAGGGYEIRVGSRLGLAPMVAWSAGDFGDNPDPYILETGRRYSVVEFKLDILWHFGRTK